MEKGEGKNFNPNLQTTNFDLPEGLKEMPEKTRDFILKRMLVIVNMFPDQAERLKGLGLESMTREEIEKAGLSPETPIAYDAIKHNLVVSSDFESQLSELAQERPSNQQSPEELSGWALQRVQLDHIILHELIHSVSFRKVETADGNIKVWTGIQQNKGTEHGVHVSKKREIENEAFSNYFAFKVLEKSDRSSEEKSIFEDSLANSQGVNLFSKLEELIGEETLAEGYFEGNLQTLVSSLNKVEVKADKLFSLIRKDNFNQAINLINRALKKH